MIEAQRTPLAALVFGEFYHVGWHKDDKDCPDTAKLTHTTDGNPMFRGHNLAGEPVTGRPAYIGPRISWETDDELRGDEPRIGPQAGQPASVAELVARSTK
jgi:hypothetical protein